MNTSTHKKTGLVYPEASKCEKSINEAYLMRDYGGLPSQIDFKDAVVMDCGANVGAFAKRAAEEGAKHVEAYEPFPACADCLEQNVGGLSPVNVRRMAITSADQAGDPLTFYYKEGNLEASSLSKPSKNQMTRWNFQTIDVPTVDFWKEVERLQPTVVKMDIEGEEWRILRAGTFPDCVRFFAVEFHRIPSNSKSGDWSGVESLLKEVFKGGIVIAERKCKTFGKCAQGTVTLRR